MKLIGLIGGTSWVSTLDYYRFINEGINQHLGGLNFANCIIYSFNFADIKKNNDANDWDKTLSMMTEAALHLKAAGAEAIVLCANTMHLIAESLRVNVGLPIIHIAIATADAIKNQGLQKVGLLGTKFTMERNFFKDKLTEQHIETLIPAEDDRNFIHDSILDELAKGIINQATKERYISVSNNLISRGAQGIILGCTEIPLLIKPQDLNVPVFDTTVIHATAAVNFSLGLTS